MRTSRLRLIGVLSAPVGTRHDALLRLCESTLEPLIDALEGSKACLALRVDGTILEFLEAHEVALADRLARLCADGRVEPVGGGFYAPILALLPWRDALGQLEMTAGFLERRTGVRPTGAWLDEGVWEPRLAEVLEAGGATWTAIDAGALRAAAIDGELDGHFVTEHVGRPLAVLPIDAALVRAVAAHDGAAVVERVRASAERLGRDVTLTWAGPASALAAGGSASGLQTLLDALELATDVTLALPGPTVEQEVGRGRVYLASGVAPAMTAQTIAPWRIAGWQRRRAMLQAAGDGEIEAEQWLRGGIWQAFLARYGEIDRLHKRMLDVSRRFAAVERVMRNGGFRAMSQLVKPRRALYRGQVGAVFGWGARAAMHDADIRAAVHAALCEAERSVEGLVRGSSDFLEVSLRDVYAELETAVLVRSRRLRVVVRPHAGGTVACLEHTASGLALHDVLTRRQELGQPPGMPEDAYERALFHDRIVPVTAAGYEPLDAPPSAGDLLTARYRLLGADTHGRGADETARITLAGRGDVVLGDGRTVAVEVVKRIEVDARHEAVRVRWAVELAEAVGEPLEFLVECNLSAATSRCEEAEVALGGGPARAAAEPQQGNASSLELRLPLRRARVGLHLQRSDAAVGALPMRLAVAPLFSLAMPHGATPRPAFQGVMAQARVPLAAGSRRLEFEAWLSVVAEGEADDAD